MTKSDNARLTIDLDQFKLHLNLPGQQALSLHFDTPSRRFYLSVIALVVEEMRRKGGAGSVPLEKHAEVLSLLNETVGEGAGSSAKKSLFPRIYTKWKAALPDLENAPLFKVIGVRKGYDEASGNVYLLDEKIKDAWANLFEYRGSREKVRLRFSVERLGLKLEDVALVFGGTSGDGGAAWDAFLDSLRSGRGRWSSSGHSKDSKEDVLEGGEPAGFARAPGVPTQGGGLVQDPGSHADLPQFSGLEDIQNWIEKQNGIQNIPLKTRLELIARLAMIPVSEQEGAHSQAAKSREEKPSNAQDGPPSTGTGSGPNSKGQVSQAQVLGMLFQGTVQTGSSALPYRAPELQEGQPPSPQSQVYALGVLLYQMVVGDLSRPLDANWAQEVGDDVLRQEISAAVETDPERRVASPAVLAQRLRNLEERQRLLLPEGVQETRKIAALLRRQQTRRRLAYGSLFAVILALLTWFGVYQKNVSRVEAAKKSAYETSLPKIRQLLDEEKHLEAYALARNIEEIIPEDPTLAGYINEATNRLNIDTHPTGADVFYRSYTDFEGPWIPMGVTPIENARIPVGMQRFKIQKEGYAERELVQPVVPRDSLSAKYREARGMSDAIQFNLYKKERVPDGMVAVDAGRFMVAIKGVPVKEASVKGPFFLDRFEVTNRAYKEFVDAGGYADPRYWQDEFKRDGNVIPWAEAMKAFVDRTGRSGPSTWELGDYPEGRDDYPVSGISWYEAAAYARFRGKSLPTLYHWSRALFTINETILPLTPSLVSQSNIEGNSIAPAGSFPGIGSSGAKDMAGNVREWVWNAAGDESRYCLGGWWRDPAYVVNDSCTPSVWDRSEGNGVRCAVYPEDAPPSDAHLNPADLRFHNPYEIPARSRESLETIKKMFTYENRPLHPVVESRTAGGKGWIREIVTIDAAYDNQRLIIYLDLPADCKPPYKAVIYWPSVNALVQTSFSRNFLWEPWDVIPKNGRALVSPIYANCFERGGGRPVTGKKTEAQIWFDRLNDVKRTIDYLETRKDIDTRDLAFLGICWGGIEGPKIAPYEDRIKTLILVSGAIYLPKAWPKPDALVQALTNIPVLMLNGKYDYVFPVETHQKPLFDLIGTPPEHKKHVVYDCGHLPLPRVPMLKEIFAWLDKYQGPVACKGESTAENADAKEDI